MKSEEVSSPDGSDWPPFWDPNGYWWINEEGKEAKFMENAFEWEHMTYEFLPYFWDAVEKNRAWMSVLEDSDPIFEAFLQAGYARVQVPVQPGMEASILQFLVDSQFMTGDNVPIPGGVPSDIIADLGELDEVPRDIPEEERTWEIRVPSTLVALQQNTSAIEEDGLPCDCPDKDKWGIGTPFNMVGVDGNGPGDDDTEQGG